MKLDTPHPDLIRKYNVPGPRYTSYPTALSFKEEEDTGVLFHSEACRRDPVSLYLHLPFCQSQCWFCACHTVISGRKERAMPYVEALEKEIDLSAAKLNYERPVTQVHLGGGTPNFLEPALITTLGETLQGRFAIQGHAECSVELDPRTLRQEHVAAFKAAGFTRASYGIQDVNTRVQQSINRIQSQEMNFKAMQWLREEGFASVNVDLIYGLPYQTTETFADTLAAVISLQPDRLAVFSYAHVPWARPSQNNLTRETELPDAETKLALLIQTIETLTAAGYVYLGMDHFAKPEDELSLALKAGRLYRNFQGYSVQAADELWGFGMSAISQNPQGYRQNLKNLRAYEQSLGRNALPVERGYRLSPDDQLRRAVIMDIMCRGAVDFAAIESAHAITFSDYFADAIERLKSMEADGLVELHKTRLTVTALGRHFLRNLAMNFDAYLRQTAERHSKTI